MRAQEAFEHVFEVGIGGANFNPSFLTPDTQLVRSPGLTIFGEYRFGIADWFAVGAQLDFKTSNGGVFSQVKKIFSDMRYFQESVKVVAEFKLFPKSTVKPLLGVTLGPGFGQFKGSLDAFFNSLVYMDLGPRVGLQVGDHFRANFVFAISPGVDAQGKFHPILDGNFTSLGINLGWVF